MAKNKRKVGYKVIHNGIEKTIVEIIRGEKTSKREYQSGITFIGFQGGQPTYVLNDGKKVTGGMVKFLPKI
jgi:hypothetical protein